MAKLLSRNQYYNQIKNQPKRKCPFCLEKQIILYAGVGWNWIAASSPYMEYHTMLVSERHIVKMSDLTDMEWLELKRLHDKIIEIYTDMNIFHKDSGLAIDGLFFGWRFRNRLLNHRLNSKNLDHFHLHIFPDKEHMLDPLTQSDAHKWNYEIFVDKIEDN